jgi:PAS domain S-box-containing protein
MDGLKYYQTILNCMGEQVYVRDLHMNILYINPAAQKLSGWTFEASMGKKCYEIFGDENLKCKDVCPVEKAIAENRSILHHEGELKTRNGLIRKMKVSISPMEEDGNIIGGIVAMQDITDFKDLQESHVKTLIKMEKIQESLKESELYLKQAQEVAGVGSWHLDIGGDVLTWSEKTYRMFGIDGQTPLNVKAFMEQVHPDDQILVASAWEEALNGVPYDMEHRIVVNGETRWVHEKAQITYDNHGVPLYGIGTVLDITKRKRAEARQRFQAQIMNQIHDSVIATDMDGMITSWNKGSEGLFHYKPDEIIGKHVSVLYPEYSFTYLRDSIFPTLLSRGNHEYETPLVRKGGEEFSALVSLSVLRDEGENITGMIGYTLDITERESARRALADSERRLNDIINFLPDPTWVIDTRGRVIAWNQAMARITGIHKKEMVGKGDYAYAVPFYGKPRPVLIDMVLNPDKEWEKEYLSIRKKDDLSIASESFHPSMGNGGTYLAGAAARLYDAEGAVVGAIETLRDITASKLAEQDRDKLIAELKEALAKVRTLSGMLPICASCKKIRDDKGYWNQIESYISKHSEAVFSHGICPECMKKLYPDFDPYSDDGNQEQ